MSARLIDGRAVAQQVRAELAQEIAAWVAGGAARPGLATVLVGNDPASAVYVFRSSGAFSVVDGSDLLPVSQVEAVAKVVLTG